VRLQNGQSFGRTGCPRGLQRSSRLRAKYCLERFPPGQQGFGGGQGPGQPGGMGQGGNTAVGLGRGTVSHTNPWMLWVKQWKILNNAGRLPARPCRCGQSMPGHAAWCLLLGKDQAPQNQPERHGNTASRSGACSWGRTEPCRTRQSVTGTLRPGLVPAPGEGPSPAEPGRASQERCVQVWCLLLGKDQALQNQPERHGNTASGPGACSSGSSPCSQKAPSEQP